MNDNEDFYRKISLKTGFQDEKTYEYAYKVQNSYGFIGQCFLRQLPNWKLPNWKLSNQKLLNQKSEKKSEKIDEISGKMFN